MRKIENEHLCVMVDDQGAQLSSLYDKKAGRELLWSADPAVWGYHAPVLFPFVGMVNEGQYRYKGNTYKIRQHGFARQSLFECVDHSDLSVTHRLVSGDETRKLFPMDFCLEEYIQYLTEHPHVALFEDGKLKYEIYRQYVGDVPSFDVQITGRARNYVSSLDNMGGVIVSLYY